MPYDRVLCFFLLGWSIHDQLDTFTVSYIGVWDFVVRVTGMRTGGSVERGSQNMGCFYSCYCFGRAKHIVLLAPILL